MSAPPDPGLTDGESVEREDRTWRWSSHHRAWLPADPGLFETVLGSSGTTWIYVPGDDEWIDILHFPDIGGGDPAGEVGRTIVRGDL